MVLPKIIHQTAPRDRRRWPREWSRCQETVQRAFPSFKYHLWTDEDLDELVQQHYPWFYSFFQAYPDNIFRADAGRYLILHHYGGIYLDMDIEVLQPFYDQLSSSQPSIVESPFPNLEVYQNSLMASPPGHVLWTMVGLEMMRCFHEDPTNVLYSTGPMMLDRVLAAHPSLFHPLPMKQYNPPPLDKLYSTTQWQTFSPSLTLYTRHLCTASWRHETW